MEGYQSVLQKIYQQQVPENDFGVSVMEILKEMEFSRGNAGAMRSYLIDKDYICQTKLRILDGFVLTEKGLREVKNSDLE